MKAVLRIFLLFTGLACILNCKPKEHISQNELATKWAELAIYITKNTPANSPTYASRCFGYIGLTMYESVVFSSSEFQSIANQLNGLKLKTTQESPSDLVTELAFNAATARILKNIYNQTSDQNKLKIDSLEQHFEHYFKENQAETKVKKSIAYGISIANQIFEWSKTDGGHRGYLKNFDKKLEFEQKPGGWQPPLYAQSFSHFPLHPYWGQNRTFVSANSLLEKPKFIPYSTDKNSDYYKQFLAVYEKERSLTQAEKEAAIWWGDDPDETPTPPGHSFYLATYVLKKTNADLVHSCQTYAMLGMSLADAFRNCWKWKYEFFTERPNTYIPANIDSTWTSFWPDPPFPAFPSGHAIQAEACATVLSGIFGEKFEITDSLHVGRRRDQVRDVDFKVRTFHSFHQISKETADSRFYGGIHTPQDNLAGQIKGKEIAENIAKLKWKR
jgi:hypothetical protein